MILNIYTKHNVFNKLELKLDRPNLCLFSFVHLPPTKSFVCVIILSLKNFQIGDLKGFFGLFMVQMQQLRKKFKVLDFTYGSGTGTTLDYAVS